MLVSEAQKTFHRTMAATFWQKGGFQKGGFGGCFRILNPKDQNEGAKTGARVQEPVFLDPKTLMAVIVL